MNFSPKKIWTVSALTVAASAALVSASATAQSAGPAQDEDNLAGLKTCQDIADNSARLACFDKAVSDIVSATEAGDITVIDREDARQTRRSLFGFTLPEIGLFESDEDEKDELFETTIKSARFIGSRKLRLVTAEDAVWELKNIPRRLQPVKPGDTAIFKPGSLGTYFIRINGQLGVRGRRVQ